MQGKTFYRSSVVSAVLFFGALPLLAQSVLIDIRAFGARPDGRTLNTQAIQAALDSVHRAGGGTVVVPAGVFLTGSVRLKSHTELRLAEGATLLGSTKRADYEKINWYALLLADGAENIVLSGPGTIDGQGAALAADVYHLVKSGQLQDPYWQLDRPHERERPQLIEFARCKNVRVTGLQLRNSSCWVQTYDRCDGLELDHLRIESMAYWNNDGIDLVDCRNAHVHDCTINSADDGICLKSSWPPAFCENILIENCTVRSSASAFKLGTSSRGGFRHIRVRNLTVYDTYRSAIALETVDGAFLEDIDIRHVRARNTGNAIFIRLGHRSRGIGTVRGVRISDVVVEIPTGRPDAGYPFEGPAVEEPHNLMPSSIVGLPGHPVRDVVLDDVEIIYGGGGRKERAYVALDSLASVPEREKDYPEFSMFGELPAWGFYVRHAEGVVLRNVRLRLKEADFRPAIVCDDVDGLVFDRCRLAKRGGQPAVVLRGVRAMSANKLRVGRKGAEILRQ
jgi:hypothetical protein